MSPADYGWPDVWVGLIFIAILVVIVRWPDVKTHQRILEDTRTYERNIRHLHAEGMCIRCEREFKQSVSLYDHEQAS